jgi:DNA polymerase sigma
VEDRKKIVSQIQDCVLQCYPTVKLELFGSSYNGFGLLRSDIDICLTFTDSETGKVGFFCSLCMWLYLSIPLLCTQIQGAAFVFTLFLSKIKKSLHVGK